MYDTYLFHSHAGLSHHSEETDLFMCNEILNSPKKVMLVM